MTASAATTVPTVSAVLIVKDEEDVLESCLRSVAWADQVVVYDTGSTDRTLEIARAHADTVVEGYWDDDFGAARNRALDHATGEWVLVLDADEVFEGDPAEVRRNLGRGDAGAHSVIVSNTVIGDDLPLAGEVHSADVAGTRFFRRGAYRYRGRIHEQPVPTTAVAPPVTRLPGVVVRHGGYATGRDVLLPKGVRNLAIARTHLEQLLRDGAPADEVELARVQVVRSLVLAELTDEMVEETRRMLDEGFLVPRNAVLLAASVVRAVEATGDHALTDRVLDVWERHDGNPAFARVQRARIAAYRDDPQTALDAAEGVPTTTLNDLGERAERAELAAVEIWALARLGRGRRAAQVARETAARGRPVGTPRSLVRLLTPERCRRVLEVMPPALWREYVTTCLVDPNPDALTFLRWMHDVRPGDPTVLGAVAVAAPLLSLEDAARWSTAMRAAGGAEHCPLVAIAQDERSDPRQRAVAGALAFHAYADERGLHGLEAALELVPREHEAELLGHLEAVAPGLVSPASA